MHELTYHKSQCRDDLFWVEVEFNTNVLLMRGNFFMRIYEVTYGKVSNYAYQKPSTHKKFGKGVSVTGPRRWQL